jgi:hypothetical protein
MPLIAIEIWWLEVRVHPGSINCNLVDVNATLPPSDYSNFIPVLFSWLFETCSATVEPSSLWIDPIWVPSFSRPPNQAHGTCLWAEMWRKIGRIPSWSWNWRLSNTWRQAIGSPCGASTTFSPMNTSGDTSGYNASLPKGAINLGMAEPLSAESMRIWKWGYNHVFALCLWFPTSVWVRVASPLFRDMTSYS